METGESEESTGNWNSSPIIGSLTYNDVTVTVSAPKGSFPQGTNVQIRALNSNKVTQESNLISTDTDAVAFDISFFSADGEKVQPDNGKTVSVLFSIPADSRIANAGNEASTLKVYHIANGGDAELMKSVLDSDIGSSTNIRVEADSFSTYVLLKETIGDTPLKTSAFRAVQNSVITKIEALLQDGSGPVGDVGQWQVFRLNAEFELPDNTIHEGDTTVITLPDKLKFNQTAGFDITDDDGNIVAHAVINGSAKTITLTYTDYAETHSDVSGSFYFYVQIDRDQVDEEEVIPLEIDVSGTTVVGESIHFTGIGTPSGNYLSKAGWQVSSDNNRELRYQLQVNTVGEAMQNVTITDKIANAGFTINQSSIVIYKGTWTVVHGDWNLENQTDVTADYEISWNSDGSFTVSLGDIAATDGFVIRYTAVADYDLVDGETIKNDAAIRGDNIRTHTASANATYLEAGGTAAGYVYTINIHKVSEDGTSLSGAEFNVIRVANNSIVGTITTDSSGEGTISGLLKDEYQLIETVAPEGYILLTEPIVVSPDDFGSDKTALKTIENESNLTSIAVSKRWDDANNQDGIQPNSVEVKLLANGEDTGEKQILDAANGWQSSFEDLNVFLNGEEITYSVEEVAVDGYTTVVTGDAETGYTITNTHEPETIEISGSKTWNDNDDQDGARPENITIRLLANGTEKEVKTVTAADNWSWSFEDLPKYENGTEINYSITEDAVSGYTVEYNDYDVTNTHTPGKTSLTVSKTWDDNDDQDGIRPQSITVKLLADGEDTGKTTELTDANNWTGSFAELDEYQNGQKITYSVEEVAVDGYTTAVTGDAETGYTITNTHEPETIEISGSKTWNDNDDQDGARPENITIRLLANGTEKEVKTVTAADNWSWSFEDLPKYENGTEINYSITEDAVSGYTVEYNDYDVTNTHTPGKTSLTVSKTWDDNDDQDGIRPQSITVKLLADGEDTGKTTELTDANNWTGSFAELDEYQNGQKITYSVEEVAVDGYTTAVTGDAETGYTITNTHEPEKRDISVAKIWNDQNNKNNSRPKSITIRLYADGKYTGKILTLNVDNKWTESFTGLDRNKDGEEIVYTISEDAVSGYKTSIKGDVNKGFTVTNTIEREQIMNKGTSGKNTRSPKTGDDINVFIYLTVALVSCGVIVWLLLRNKKRKGESLNL